MPIGSFRPEGTGGWSSEFPRLTPNFALLPGTADRVETPVTCRKQKVAHASTRDDSHPEFRSALPGPFSGRNAYTSRNQTLCAQNSNALSRSTRRSHKKETALSRRAVRSLKTESF